MIIQASTMKFLSQLAKNNNKEWFDRNKSAYESAKKNFLEFNTALVKSLQAMDDELGDIDPKKTIFRINRDIRFSKDKSPYKTNMGTSINKGGKKVMTAGYYSHLEPGNKSFAAVGVYQPEPEILSAIRQEIDYNLAEFNKIMKAAAFRKYFDGLDEFDKLKTAPKGYPPDHPAIEILKNRHFIVTRYVTDKEIQSPGFLKELTSAYKAAYRFNEFLNKAVS